MHACRRSVDRRAFDKLTTSDVGRDAMNRFIILFVIVIIYMVMIHSRRWRILIIIIIMKAFIMRRVSG